MMWLVAVPAFGAERLTGRAHALGGDTIVVGGNHVRLKGVAAPKVAHAGVPVHSFETPLCAYAAIGIGLICSART